MMNAKRRRRTLAASVVVTVSAAGCDGPSPARTEAASSSAPTAPLASSTSPPPLASATSFVRFPADLLEVGTSCFYRSATTCAPNGPSCNPPPAYEAECPADLRDGAAMSGPTREGAVRLKERISCYSGQCRYTSEYFCADPRKGGPERCDTPVTMDVPCKLFTRDAAARLPPGGKPDWHYVESFVGRRADGSCTRIPAHWRDPASERGGEFGRPSYNYVPPGKPTPCP